MLYVPTICRLRDRQGNQLSIQKLVDSRTDTQVRVSDGKIITCASVHSIILAGKMPTIRIRLRDGAFLATRGAKIAIPGGCQPVQALSSGSIVLANGLMAYMDKEWLKKNIARGRTARDIARECGVEEQTIVNHLRLLGLKKGNNIHPILDTVGKKKIIGVEDGPTTECFRIGIDSWSYIVISHLLFRL